MGATHEVEKDYSNSIKSSQPCPFPAAVAQYAMDRIA